MRVCVCIYLSALLFDPLALPLRQDPTDLDRADGVFDTADALVQRRVFAVVLLINPGDFFLGALLRN
jgi:hypothetical protein